MSVEQITLSNMKKMNEFLISHMQDMISKMDHKKLKINWIYLLSGFYDELIKICNNYHKNIFKICNSFQKNVNLKFQDDKFAQYFQLLINNLLKYQNNVAIQTKDIEKQNQNLLNQKNDFINTCEINFLESKKNLEQLKTKMKVLDTSYSKYIKSNKKKEKIYNNKKEIIDNKKLENELKEINKIEQKTLNQYEELENGFNFNLEYISEKIKKATDLELKLKKKVSESMVNVANIIWPVEEKINKEKIENLERNLDHYSIYFLRLQKEINLDFHSSFKLHDMSSSFIDSYKFKKLTLVNSLNYIKFLNNKLSRFEKNISPKKKIYMEIFIENIYRSNSLLKKSDLQKLSSIFIENHYFFFYFYYLLIYKKSQILLQKPFVNLNLTEVQIKNFLILMENFFICFSTTNDNFEILYHLIRFNLSLLNNKKETIYKLLNKNVILQTPNVWLGLYKFFYHTFGPDGLVFEEIFSHSNRVEKNSSTFLSKVIKNIKTTPDIEIVAHNNFTFQEILRLILKCKFKFDFTKKIILALVSKIDLNFKTIKTILNRYEPEFYFLIKSKDDLDIVIYKKKLIKKKNLQKEKKLYLCLKNTIKYLNSNSDIFNILITNKKMLTFKKKIFNHILLKKQLKNKKLRRKIYLNSINNKYLTNTIEIYKKNEVDPIIDLDVKRTLNYENKFGDKGLTLILRNISHPNKGNFPYYQGLNYLTNYFYILFEGNTLDCYNLLITLMKDKFDIYVDKDLRNMKILFFNMKKLIKKYLPLLSNYYEEIKLDMDIIFAAWCLTIFTTISHSFKNSKILDDIVDIFIGKGWPGFFKVVLVILEETQDEVFKKDFDSNLLFYSEICKNGFKFIRDKYKDKGEEFDFKEKILKYKYVNSCQSTFLKAEYDKVQEIYQDFWIEISKTFKFRKSKSMIN